MYNTRTSSDALKIAAFTVTLTEYARPACASGFVDIQYYQSLLPATLSFASYIAARKGRQLLLLPCSTPEMCGCRPTKSLKLVALMLLGVEEV